MNRKRFPVRYKLSSSSDRWHPREEEPWCFRCSSESRQDFWAEAARLRLVVAITLLIVALSVGVSRALRGLWTNPQAGFAGEAQLHSEYTETHGFSRQLGVSLAQDGLEDELGPYRFNDNSHHDSLDREPDDLTHYEGWDDVRDPDIVSSPYHPLHSEQAAASWDATAGELSDEDDKDQGANRIQIALWVTLPLSIVFCVAIVVHHIISPRLQKHPASLVLGRSVYDALCCAMLLTSQIVLAYHRKHEVTKLNPAHHDHHPHSEQAGYDLGSIMLGDSHNGTDSHGASWSDKACRPYSFFVEFASVGAEMYVLMISIDFVLAINNPFSNFNGNRWGYHIGVMLTATALSSMLIGFRGDFENPRDPFWGEDKILGLCWLRREAGDDIADSFITFFIAPMVIVYAVAVYAIIFAHHRLQRGLPATLKTRLAVFRLHIAFVFSYLIYWLLVAGTFIATNIKSENDSSSSTAKSETFGVVLLGLALGSRGIVTGLVWFWSQSCISCRPCLALCLTTRRLSRRRRS